MYIFVVFVRLIPESPKWLLGAKNDRDAATSVLTSIRNVGANITAEVRTCEFIYNAVHGLLFICCF